MINTSSVGTLELDATSINLLSRGHVDIGTFTIEIDVHHINQPDGSDAYTTTTIYITGNLKYCDAIYPSALDAPIELYQIQEATEVVSYTIDLVNDAKTCSIT